MSNCRFSIEFSEESVHLGEFSKCFDHCIANKVSEGNLSTTRTLQVIINDRAIINHQLCRNCTNACGRRNSERSLHALNNAICNSAQWFNSCGTWRCNLRSWFCNNLSRCWNWLSCGTYCRLWCESFVTNWRRCRRWNSSWRRSTLLLALWNWRSSRSCRRRNDSRFVTSKEFAPIGFYRIWIGEVTLVHLIDKPFIGAKRATKFIVGSHTCHRK